MGEHLENYRKYPNKNESFEQVDCETQTQLDYLAKYVIEQTDYVVSRIFTHRTDKETI